MDKVEVKFGDWIEQGLNVFKAHMALLIVASIPVVLVMLAVIGAAVGLGLSGHVSASYPLGIVLSALLGPLYAGLILIVLQLHDRRQPPPQAGDITKGFRWFMPAAVYMVGLSVVQLVIGWMLRPIPCIGSLVAMILSAGITALTMFVLFNIVDRGLPVMDAVKDSVQHVLANFWPLLGLSVVASVIGALGALLCGVGLVLSIPAATCILAVAYRAVYGLPVAATGVPPPLA